jgi:hypothetical protein
MYRENGTDWNQFWGVFWDHNGRICTSPRAAAIYATANDWVERLLRGSLRNVLRGRFSTLGSFCLLRIGLRRRQLIGKLRVGLTEQGGDFGVASRPTSGQ